MNSLLTLNEIINLSKTITGMCEGILLRNGPFLKEGIYQDLLVHELQQNSMVTTRELVFPYRMIDSEGESLMIECLQKILLLDLEKLIQSLGQIFSPLHAAIPHSSLVK